MRSPAASRTFLAVATGLVALLAGAWVSGATIQPAVVSTDGTLALTLAGTPSPGWDTAWVSRDVTVSAVASSSLGPAVILYKQWRSGVETEPAVFTATGSSTATRVVSAEGTTTLVMRAYRSSDFQSVTATRAVRIDKTAPSIRFSTTVPLVSAWTSQSVPVAMSAEDSLSGPSGPIRYRTYRNGVLLMSGAGSGFTLEAEGRHAVEATATDVAGNVSPVYRMQVGIDRSPPVTRWSGPAYFFGRAVVSFAATDTLSGIKETRYRLGDGPVETGGSLVVTLPADASSVATHTITFWSVDVAGNVETNTAAANSATFTIEPDRIAPTTTISALDGLPVSAWRSTGITLALAGDDTSRGAGVATAYYRVWGSELTTYTAPFRVDADGVTLFDYHSVDHVGNAGTPKTALVRIDRGAPSSTYQAQARYDGPAAIPVVAHDAESGAASVQAWVDDGMPRLVASGTDGEATLTAVAECSIAGTHTVSWVVSDFAGNCEPTQTVTVHVTGTPAVVLSTKSTTLSNTKIPAATSVSGTLRDGSRVLAGRRVRLEYSSSSSFSGAKSVSTTTSATGRFSFGMSLYGRTYVRVRFAGDEDFRPAVSSAVRLVPRHALSTPAAGSPQRAYRTFAVAGTLRPGHSSATNVYVWRYKYSATRGRYVYVDRVRASVTNKGSYATYRASMRMGRGSWRLYAYAPADTLHGAGVSAHRKVVVR